MKENDARPECMQVPQQGMPLRRVQNGAEAEPCCQVEQLTCVLCLSTYAGISLQFLCAVSLIVASDVGCGLPYSLKMSPAVCFHQGQ